MTISLNDSGGYVVDGVFDCFSIAVFLDKHVSVVARTNIDGKNH